ncbi:hypothetical protein CL655_03365 [bacterium]|nr:hypothetical protein [bacterium]|tara:strand:+ start:207 stop:494 length:288 start_codon:yes stop_codon:yes gene_type:complete
MDRSTPRLEVLPDGDRQAERTKFMKALRGDHINVLREHQLLPDDYTWEDMQSLLNSCAAATGNTITSDLVSEAINGNLPSFAHQAISGHLAATTN